MSIRLKIIVSLFLVSAVIVLGATGTSYWLLQSSLSEEFRGRLKNIAYIGAKSVDMQACKRLIAKYEAELNEDQVKTVEEFSDYILVDQQLQAIREAEPKLIQYVYILTPTKTANGSRFLVDADVLALNAKQKKGEKVEEEISHFGLEYDISDKEFIKKAFETNSLIVEDKFTPDPNYNTNSLSAYAPIRDENGQLLGILGLDLKDEDMQAALLKSKMISIIIVLLSLIATTIISIIVGHRLTRGIRLMDSVVKQFAMKQFDARVPVLSKDEIGNLGNSFNSMAQTIDTYAKHLEALLAAYGRFVPHSFLKLLKKESVIELKLGDHVQQEMTILFSDIRASATLSESMTPQENFDFINAFLKRVGPVIRNHGGVIDKYIGDCVMALFPNSASEAIAAAIAMQKQVTKYNVDRVNNGRQPIAIGVGLHTGKLILGTVGEAERMNSTVIADAVNLASRLEGVTKHYKVGIVVSEDTVSQLFKPITYQLRFLDKVQVKGKKKYVSIYEVFDADPEQKRLFKEQILEQWNSAVELFYAKKFKEAETIFQAILERDQSDHPTQMFLQRVKDCLANGVTEDWSGVEIMETK